MRQTRNGTAVAKCGMVKEIYANRADKVKTGTCPRYFRKSFETLLNVLRRLCIQMIHYQIQRTRFRYLVTWYCQDIISFLRKEAHKMKKKYYFHFTHNINLNFHGGNALSFKLHKTSDHYYCQNNIIGSKDARDFNIRELHYCRYIFVSVYRLRSHFVFKTIMF